MSYAISILNVPQDMCGPYLFLDAELKANSQILKFALKVNLYLHLIRGKLGFLNDLNGRCR